MKKYKKNNDLTSILLTALGDRLINKILFSNTNQNEKLLALPIKLLLSETINDNGLKRNIQTGILANTGVDLLTTPIHAEKRETKKTIEQVLKDISTNFDEKQGKAHFNDGFIWLLGNNLYFFLNEEFIFTLNDTEDFIRWITITGTKTRKYNSLNLLIEENRKSYFQYVLNTNPKNLGGSLSKNQIDMNKSGSGKNNYIAFPQGVSDNSDGGLLECYGTTLVYTMRHVGYIDGTLSNKELTKKYLERSINDNGLKFSKDAIHDYRGLSEGKLNYFGYTDKTNRVVYNYDRIEAEIKKFQYSDFSKLMGNASMEVKLIILENKPLIENVKRVHSGYPVQFVGNAKMFFGSRHYVLPYFMKTIDVGREYDMYYIDPIRVNEDPKEKPEDKEYYDNGNPVDPMVARKKRSYDINIEFLHGKFPWMFVPKTKYEEYK